MKFTERVVDEAGRLHCGSECANWIGVHHASDEADNNEHHLKELRLCHDGAQFPAWDSQDVGIPRRSCTLWCVRFFSEEYG